MRHKAGNSVEGFSYTRDLDEALSVIAKSSVRNQSAKTPTKKQKAIKMPTFSWNKDADPS